MLLLDNHKERTDKERNLSNPHILITRGDKMIPTQETIDTMTAQDWIDTSKKEIQALRGKVREEVKQGFR